jgi:transglutaminase-like putative cysteine protease
VVFALFLPVFVPGLHVTRLVGGQPGIGGNGSGGGGAGFPAPETVVSQQLQESKPQPVLTYNALGSGTTVPQYLQLYVLDQLTDAGWQLASQPAVTLSTSRGVMPPPPGLTLQRGYDVVEDGTPREVRTVPGATSVATSVQLSPDLSTVAQLKTRVAAVLPVPYPATQVVAPGDWQATQADLTVSSPATAVASSVVRYDVFSAQLQPSPAALATAGPPPAAIKRSYLSLPPSYLASGQLGALVGEITGGQQTAYGKAEAIEAWLSDSGTFSYSLKAPTVTSALQLQSFLTTTRKGYCQQFAVAMADLARLAGIPSRVVIGYTSGSRQSDGSWKVTTRDAHEWPELYFSGYGWLRFEPTPGGLDGQGSATVPAYASQSTDTTGKGAPGEPPNLAIGPANVSPGPHQAGGGVRTLEGGPDGKVAIGSGENATAVSALDIGGLVVAGLAVLALIAPGTARLVIRRRRWRRAARGGDAALAHVAWRELQDDLINYRAGYSASETPRALSARVGARVAATGTAGEAPEASVAALRRITLAEEQARYAAHPVPGDLLRRDSAEFHRALVATMPRRARWRARLLPLSVLVPAASGVSQAADAVGNVRLPRPRRGQLDSPGR